MPPYHRVSGSTIEVFVELIPDTDGPGTPQALMAANLLSIWGLIADAHGLSLVINLGPNTSGPLPSGTTGVTFNQVTSAPAGVSFFTITVGQGTAASQTSKASRTSYVNYSAGTGYWYWFPLQSDELPAASHELAHILGLSDRYFEGLSWLNNVYIDRTCREIRQSNYFMDDGTDTRDGTDDPLPYNDQPRLAVRNTLPMAAVPGDTQYQWATNLMSNGAATLTPFQIDMVLQCSVEPNYRVEQWVAILGAYIRDIKLPKTVVTGMLNMGVEYPIFPNAHTRWVFPVREATSTDGGRGLIFEPPGIGEHRYPCVSRLGRARDAAGDIILPDRIADGLGRRRVYHYVGSVHLFSQYTGSSLRERCHVRSLLMGMLTP